jgi:hypothetical protein
VDRLEYKSTGITKSQNTSFVLLRVYNLVGCVLESENLWESISSSCNGLEHPGTPGSSPEYQEHQEEIAGFLLMDFTGPGDQNPKRSTPSLETETDAVHSISFSSSSLIISTLRTH